MVRSSWRSNTRSIPAPSPPGRHSSMVYLPSIELDYNPRDVALLIFPFESKLTLWTTEAYDTPSALASSERNGTSPCILRASR